MPKDVIKKVNDGDKEEMQKFVDAYMTAGDKFWDKDYKYSAFVLGKSIVQYIDGLSKASGLLDRLLCSRTVKAGEVVRYDKDPYVVAFILDETKEVKDIGVGRYVYPPEFETSFSIKFPDQVANTERFFDTLRNEALNKLIQLQDAALVKLIKGITNRSYSPICETSEKLLERLLYEVEQHRIPVKHILVNTKSSLKIESDKLAIIKTDLVDEQQMYALAEPAYIGGAPIRVELLCEPLNQADKGKEPYKGLFFYKLLSMVVINPSSVAEGRISESL